MFLTLRWNNYRAISVMSTPTPTPTPTRSSTGNIMDEEAERRRWDISPVLLKNNIKDASQKGCCRKGEAEPSSSEFVTTYIIYLK